MLAIATTTTSSKIQNATSATKIAISKIDIIKALILRNCLLKIKQFCISFSNYTKCNNLLLNISNIIPETITSFISNKI